MGSLLKIDESQLNPDFNGKWLLSNNILRKQG
jgi:hypothetical protein